jgi:hypothetical protein
MVIQEPEPKVEALTEIACTIAGATGGTTAKVSAGLTEELEKIVRNLPGQ